MYKFQKKPVSVEAVQFLGIHKVPDWWTAASTAGALRLGDDLGSFMLLQTLEGVQRVNLGDWVIRGPEGGLHICSPTIFRLIYEAVE